MVWKGNQVTTTETLTRQQKVEIDTRLSEIHEAVWKAEQEIESLLRILNRIAGRKSWDEPLRLSELLTMQTEGTLPEYSHTWRRRPADVFAAITEQQAIIAALHDEAAPLNALYAEHRWSRFFLVTNDNGHIHSSMHCSTCYITTMFAWLPALSDQTEAEAVAAHGGILCSVCFPTAPTEWTDQPSHAKAAAMAERAAAKAERLAKKLEKALLPDGSETTLTNIVHGRHWNRDLRDWVEGEYKVYSTITTLAQAKTWLREVSDARAGGRGAPLRAMQWVAKDNAWTPENEAWVVAAIAAKIGSTPEAVAAEFKEKAEKKARKNGY